MRGPKFISSAILTLPKHLSFSCVLVLWPQVRASPRLSKHHGWSYTPKSPGSVYIHTCVTLHTLARAPAQPLRSLLIF